MMDPHIVDYRTLLVKYMKRVVDASGSDHLLGINPCQYNAAELEALQDCSDEAYLIEDRE